MQTFPLGRREPLDYAHLAAYPFQAVMPSVISTIELMLPLPSWHHRHDQGQEGACVGFGTSMMLSVLHTGEALRKGDRSPYIRYNPFWLWNQAKLIDPWPDTNPGDDNGTTVSAACETLRTKGHVGWPVETDPSSMTEACKDFGIQTYRWARTVDEVRTAISKGIPLALGCNWYTAFDAPEIYKNEFWIGRGATLGTLRGGHCVCIYGASDLRQAVKIKNSWGNSYPEVWLPFSTLDHLLRENAELALVTDL